jgi:hypothetical protein
VNPSWLGLTAQYPFRIHPVGAMQAASPRGFHSTYGASRAAPHERNPAPTARICGAGGPAAPTSEADKVQALADLKDLLDQGAISVRCRAAGS